MKVTFLGHAGFQVEEKGVSLLFDPFLTGNPVALARPSEIRANYILVSHAHGDHLGDAVEIAKNNDAMVISTFEVANLIGEKGARSHGMHIGGKKAFDFGHVRITQAFHGSGVPGGHACGFMVRFFGRTIYHTGDTGIFGDMKLLADLEPVDLAFVPIGGNYTMDTDDAAVAVSLIRPKVVIPMHYDTFPLIKADPLAFKNKVEVQVPDTRVEILRPGESVTL